MQDSSIYSQIKPQFPEQEHLNCPRCDSPNTKFCYYNNYNLSQPRHYCKSCRRYWTKGGTLRNIPVGGGSRKNTKRSSSAKKISSTTAFPVSSATIPVTSSFPKQEPSATIPAFDHNSKIIDMSGPFSSLLASNEPQFENLLEALNSDNGSSLQLGPNSKSGLDLGSGSGSPNGNHHNTDGYLGVQNGGDSNCWNGTNGWPDLAIYTPGSNFQ